MVNSPTDFALLVLCLCIVGCVFWSFQLVHYKKEVEERIRHFTKLNEEIKRNNIDGARFLHEFTVFANKNAEYLKDISDAASQSIEMILTNKFLAARIPVAIGKETIRNNTQFYDKLFHVAVLDDEFNPTNLNVTIVYNKEKETMRFYGKDNKVKLSVDLKEHPDSVRIIHPKKDENDD